MNQIASDIEWDLPCQPRVKKFFSGDGIRILWWNIQSGETNRKIMGESNGGESILDQNLLAYIASEERPDVVLLGEYSADSFSDVTLRALKSAYPYTPDHYWAYNKNTPEIGLMLWSRYPFEMLKNEPLDYFPPTMTDKTEVEAYQADWARGFPGERTFIRPYLNLRIDHPHGALHVVPFHGLIHIEKEYARSNGGFLSILKIKVQYLFGKNNPIIHQLRRLRHFLEVDFGPNFDRAPVIIMGDFNLPRKLFGILSRAYRVISPRLQDAFEEIQATTWPMPSAKEFKEFSLRVQIDHAFVSPSLQILQSAVLPMRGSDHAAIAIQVRREVSKL
jgi:endonuclease/exonuclease/phosphatase family metal-dependent hydrolase